MEYRLCKHVMLDENARASYNALAKKFGFRRQQQYEYAWNPEPEQVQNVSAQVQKRFEHAQKMSKIDLLQNEKSVQEILLTNVDVKRLNMSDNADVCLLKRYYEKTNPFSKLSVKNNFNLLMFYLKSFMKDFVYYSKAADAVLVAEVDKAVLRCYDIYCDAEISLEEILKGFFPKVLPKVQFLFTPTEESTCEVTLHQDEDDVLFVWEGKENIFAGDRLLFPEISHT